MFGLEQPECVHNETNMYLLNQKQDYLNCTWMAEQQEECLICDQQERTQIVLHCGHNFCLVCISYMVLKSRANGNPATEVVCGHCNRVSKLDSDSLDLIQETIEDRLIPQLDGSPSSMMHKGVTFSKNQISVQSFGNRTPSTNVNNKQSKRSFREFCPTHPLQQLAFVCLSCENTPLCLKCIMSKDHSEHQIKNFAKAIKILGQKLDFLQFQIAESSQLVDSKKRTLKDRQALLLQCWQKSRKNIQESFERLANCLHKKELQLLDKCNSCYEELNLTIEEEFGRFELNLDKVGKTKQLLRQLSQVQEDEYLEFLSLYNSFKREVNVLHQESGHNKFIMDISVEAKQGLVLLAFESIGGLDIQIDNIREQLKTQGCESQYEINVSQKSRRISKVTLTKSAKKLPDYVSKFLQRQGNDLVESYHSMSRNTFQCKTRLQKSRLFEREMRPSDSSSQLQRRKSPLDKLRNQKQLFEHKKGRQF